MIKTLSGLLLLLTTACSAQVDKCADWAVGDDFTDQDYADIQAGADLWNVAAEREVVRVVRQQRDSCAFKYADLGPDYAGFSQGHTISLGREYLTTEYARFGTRDHCLESVSAHELGHQIGILEHVSDPQAIMYKYNNCNVWLTDADVAECRRVGVCP